MTAPPPSSSSPPPPPASSPPAAPSLSAEQVHALFDILSHHETYAEIERFKFPDAVTSYGYPFAPTTIEPAVVSGWRSWATTPANSQPGTPRSRTPVPPAASKDGNADEAPRSETSSNAKGALNPTSEGPDENDESQLDDDRPSEAPILQTLQSRFLLRLPGIRELPRDFWSIRVQGLLGRLGEADLSESYDKGTLGTRKMLATGMSGVMEMLGRGALGGVKRRKTPTATDINKQAGSEPVYDRTKADDLERGWEDNVDGLVYGDLVDKVFDHLSKSDDLEALSPSAHAAADYAIIHLATFMHHIFVLSPEGQYVLKLMENIHNLIPYKMVKQTLRVGNAATMISGMMRLLLAKLSVTSLTNWVGLTASADDGMNLLQRIIWLVLSWDSGEFRKITDKIEKSKDRPTEDQLQAIRQYVSLPRDEHETVRAASEEHSQSIITAIFNATNPELNQALEESQHAQCLEYYSALLSIHDREGITTALCRQPPDLFTAMVKDVFAAYEPILRTVHSNIDLRVHVDAGQAFIDDFIRSSKPKKPDGTSTPLGGMRTMMGGEAKPAKMPSVDDYVQLLTRNRGLLYKWIHSLAGSCPEIWEEMRKWAKEAVLKFRQEYSTKELSSEGQGTEVGGEGAKKEPLPASSGFSVMEAHLDGLFQALPTQSRGPVTAALDSHVKYLNTLTVLSKSRLQRLIDTKDLDSRTMAGPGIFLAKWQSLLERTPVTPAAPKGPVRHGAEVKHVMAMGKVGVAGSDKAREAALQEAEEGPEAPDVQIVVREMGDGFRKLLQEIGGR